MGNLVCLEWHRRKPEAVIPDWWIGIFFTIPKGFHMFSGLSTFMEALNTQTSFSVHGQPSLSGFSIVEGNWKLQYDFPVEAVTKIVALLHGATMIILELTPKSHLLHIWFNVYKELGLHEYVGGASSIDHDSCSILTFCKYVMAVHMYPIQYTCRYSQRVL